MIPFRVDIAIDLYNKGLVKKILLTGYKPLLSTKKEVEADIMLDYLLKHNIPKEDIILERKSKTTKENIINSIKLINKDDSIILISSDFHLKRIKKLFTNYAKNKVYVYGSKDGITDKDNWYKTIKGRKQIIRELFLLKM